MYTDMSGQERSVPFGADAPVVSIGRATDCTIRSNRKSVSRRHAEFRFSNNQFEVVDLNSSNGTYLIINEERKPVLGREYLAHNDEVWCGDFILRFYEEDAPTADNYDDNTFNSPGQHAQHQHQPTQPPQFGGPSNGHFGQQNQQQSWSPPPPQPGPMFGNQQAPPPFTNAPQSSFGSEPQFAEPAYQADAFGNEPSAGGFGNEPSFANDPPDFGEPVTSGPPTSNPYEEASTQNHGGYDQQAFDTSTQNQAELAQFMQSNENVERLEQERDAYAELAERQKGEIEDLQARLNETQAELDDVKQDIDEIREEQRDSTSVATPPAEVARLRDDLVSARSQADELRGEVESAHQDAAAARQELEALKADTTAADLQDELQRLRDENSALEHEVATARQMAAEPDHEAQAEIESLREQVAGKERDVAALESEVDRLSAQMQDAESEASERSRHDAQKSREETEALRRELERHKRLVEEFEKRNRDMQTGIEAQSEQQDALREQLGEGDAKRAELEAELEALASNLEAARTERDEAHAATKTLRAQGDPDDLRNEIEGLKHRLKMEKERAGEGDAKLAEENDRLNGIVNELEAENTNLKAELEAASAAGGATAEDIALLREKVEALDRIVDAIVRTNLDPLSTVDRIRLQSAIRDTDPKATLAKLLEITAPD